MLLSTLCSLFTRGWVSFTGGKKNYQRDQNTLFSHLSPTQAFSHTSMFIVKKNVKQNFFENSCISHSKITPNILRQKNK